MNRGIEIAIDWWDEDVIMFVFRASNGSFSGEMKAYLPPNTLAELANGLSGFPSHTSDQRAFELGGFSILHAGGGIELRFHCLDSAGHAAVDVKLRSDACAAWGELESAALRIPLEAAAVDNFVDQIRRLEKFVGASVVLRMAEGVALDPHAGNYFVRFVPGYWYEYPLSSFPDTCRVLYSSR
jgi:hypothetical protein